MGETETEVDGEIVGAGKRMRQAFKDPKFVIMFIIAVVMAIWGTVSFVQNQRAMEAISARQPDTSVVVYGMEHSYSIDELMEQGAITYKAVISAVQVPGGFYQLKTPQFLCGFLSGHIQMMRQCTS